jgi:hypothetical protein
MLLAGIFPPYQLPTVYPWATCKIIPPLNVTLRIPEIPPKKGSTNLNPFRSDTQSVTARHTTCYRLLSKHHNKQRVLETVRGEWLNNREIRIKSEKEKKEEAEEEEVKSMLVVSSFFCSVSALF